MKTIRSLLVACILLLNTLQSPVQGQDRWQISRIDSEIIFDGLPDEAAWEQVEPFPMISHFPVSGNPPGEESVIRMAYDDQYLYVKGCFSWNAAASLTLNWVDTPTCSTADGSACMMGTP